MIQLRHIPSNFVNKDCTYEIIDNTNKPIAKAIVFKWTYSQSFDFSAIHTENIPQTVEAIIQYAKQQNTRIIEFPHIYLYFDGVYKGDVLHYDLLNDKKYETSDSDEDFVLLYYDRLHNVHKQSDSDEDLEDYVDEDYEDYVARTTKEKHLMSVNQDAWGINGKIWKYLQEKYADVMTLLVKDPFSSECTSDLRYKRYVPILCIPRVLNVPIKRLHDVKIEVYDDDYSRKVFVFHKTMQVQKGYHQWTKGLEGKEHTNCYFNDNDHVVKKQNMSFPQSPPW